MEIGYLGNILMEIGGLLLVAAGCIGIYYIGLTTGKQRAIDNVKDLLCKNSDENGICKIQTNIEG